MTSEIPKVGEITTNVELRGKRDAHHMAGALVSSPETLRPGCPVRFLSDALDRVVATSEDKKEAIVDPFLSQPLEPGQICWALLVPGSTYDLSHHFKVHRENAAIEAVLNQMTGDEPVSDDDDFDDNYAEYDECRGC